MPPTSKKIAPPVKKAFLEAVERRNLSRGDISVKDICDVNPDLFGGRNSETRVNLGEFWKNSKKRSISSYVEMLSDLGVVRGRGTEQELVEYNRQQVDKNNNKKTTTKANGDDDVVIDDNSGGDLDVSNEAEEELDEEEKALAEKLERSLSLRDKGADAEAPFTFALEVPPASSTTAATDARTQPPSPTPTPTPALSAFVPAELPRVFSPLPPSHTAVPTPTPTRVPQPTPPQTTKPLPQTSAAQPVQLFSTQHPAPSYETSVSGMAVRPVGNFSYPASNPVLSPRYSLPIRNQQEMDPQQPYQMDPQQQYKTDPHQHYNVNEVATPSKMPPGFQNAWHGSPPPSQVPSSVSSPLSVSTGTMTLFSVLEAKGDYIGSKNSPYTFRVDAKYPERNLIFDIERVKRLEMPGGHAACEGYFIRTQIGIGDLEYWSAYMDDTPGLEGRSVIFVGRSRSSAYDQITQYHRKDFSDDVKACHEGTLERHKRDPGCLLKYYRAVFGNDIKLDNTLLSGHSKVVEMKPNAFTYTVDSVNCMAMFAEWSIGIEGSSYRLQKTATKTALADLFK